MRAVQGHSGGTMLIFHCKITWKILFNWIEYIYHIGSSHDCNSIIKSGLVAGGKDTHEGRQTVFFTAMVLLNQPHKDEPYVAPLPRVVPYRTKGKLHRQNHDRYLAEPDRKCSRQRISILTNTIQCYHPSSLFSSGLFE